jgi:hypothetical protein
VVGRYCLEAWGEDDEGLMYSRGDRTRKEDDMNLACMRSTVFVEGLG